MSGHFIWILPILEEYDLHLNQLGAEGRQKFGALLNLSVGTPKMKGAMAVLEANEQEDVEVSVESDHEQNQIVHLRPNQNFSFLKSGFSRKLHVVPLIFGLHLSHVFFAKADHLQFFFAGTK